MSSVWLKQLVVVIPVAFASGEVFAFDWSDLWQRPDQRAYEMLQQGDLTSAAEKFTDPQWRGVSHYRAGDFEQAQQEFSSLEGDAGLYNQGVTALQQGEFDAAIEKFESLMERSPDHADGQHNLEIARELAKQQEQQEEQQQQQDGDQQEGGDQQEDSDQPESEGEQQADSDPGDEQGDPEEDDQRGGELAADPDEAGSDGEEPESDQQSQTGEQDQEQSDEQSQQQLGGSQNGGEEQEQPASMVPAGPSESEQATEQWLRRIPDDPSQLLRNKIKLNHMIEHSDVQDMQEPW